ncbi:family 43 glycosylhydrolase [Bacteroides sp. 519]|uniref:family 43 glycosylhydrolase n=1 Tax=Bacteroides sp. 519 TaxID=2302937 RepID=UPI0013D1D8F0|nr:family 43 glycosylhydrolase [Bacteroides sp. 519]NDV60007.1 arabinan endo-1,5-alpha-L-arabinosidase [Bacteroides sp. 519]
MKIHHLLFAGLFFLLGCNNAPTANHAKTVELNNPILPGYFADPSLVQYDGKFYMYVTADPWGTDFLSCWVSDDFQNWTFNKLNWPTKEACTSAKSGNSMVWAPSVIQKGDMFYMYVSVGSEVWCGKASHPLGPWENALGDVPMIEYDLTKYYHVIDAEVFNDDNGRSYLYWGSGWNWINGHCFAAELNDDMSSFKTEAVEVTPTRYFEAPLMVKHNSKYYLTYSEGKTMDETYEVRYAVGDNPLGPFTEAANSPVLTMNDSLKVYGPGHHTMFTYEDKNYILYHRHRWPFETGTAYRQTCISEFTFNDTRNEINTIIPYHTQTFPNIDKPGNQYLHQVSVTASSQSAEYHSAANVLDNSYATRWEAAEDDKAPSLTASVKEDNLLKFAEILFEYSWKTYYFKAESSNNGKEWHTVADFTESGISGSPVVFPITVTGKQLRITFVDNENAAQPSIWEIRFY